MHKFHYIYKITSLVSNRYYVGMHSTNNLDDGYLGSGLLVNKSIRKHGKDKHIKEILEFLPDRESLKLRELEIVNAELLQDSMCMNLRKGGDGGDTFSYLTDDMKETKRKKLSIAGKGRIKGPHTEEIKQKIAISRKKTAEKHFVEHGVYQTEEHRRKNIDANTGENNHFYGKTHTDKAKQAMSEKRKGHSWMKNYNGTDEELQLILEERSRKLREANIGKKHTPETLEKLKLVNKDKHHWTNIEGKTIKAKDDDTRLLEGMWVRGRKWKNI